jgi:hypothetical protein
VNLLRCKWLFDQFILRRDYLHGKEKWSLKKLKKSNSESHDYVNTFGKEENDTPESTLETLIMLQSMFHVSSPAFTSKHWMNAALKILFDKKFVSGNVSIDVGDYIGYLEDLARKYLRNRYLGTDSGVQEFHQIIYKDAELVNSAQVDLRRLHRGVFVENFIFNYLDYLLWKSIKDKKSIDFTEFSSQNSVEHYYPQNPTDNNPEIAPEWLHHFVNLCLMNAGANARFSNNMPLAKKSNFENVKKESIKQQLMMLYDQWGKEEIQEHGNQMIDILLERFPSARVFEDLRELIVERNDEPNQ